MQIDRRDFLLLRAGQPAVLSCEQLFMRYVDAHMNGTTGALFAALGDDLRAARSVRITDTSWLSRPDLKRELDAVLAVFAAAGGRIVSAIVVAGVLVASMATVFAQAKIAPKSGAAMCAALTASDLSHVGIGSGAKPSANVDDNGASAYCVYAGKSAATGGVELDVFYPAGANATEAKATFETAIGELASVLKPVAFAGADEARWSARARSGGPDFATIVVRRSNLVFTLGIPPSADAQKQLFTLGAIVLQRF